MRFLLDTHIFIGLTHGTLESSLPHIFELIHTPESELYLSVASIWEISIKVQLGKLDVGLPSEKIEAYCDNLGITVIPILASHTTAIVTPEPPTRDPFDRLLLAQCKIEELQLITIDRALVNHPYAFKAT